VRPICEKDEQTLHLGGNSGGSAGKSEARRERLRKGGGELRGLAKPEPHGPRILHLANENEAGALVEPESWVVFLDAEAESAVPVGCGLLNERL
jgi:hypothetical protein